jgi:Domain of unknown function (DUF2014)/Helix-loop-helix DNA-binding domain
MSIDPATLSMMETTVEPFLNQDFPGLAISPSVSTVQPFDSSVYADSLSLQNPSQPPSSSAFQPISWQDVERAREIAFPLDPPPELDLTPSPEPVFDSASRKRKLPPENTSSKGQGRGSDKKKIHNVVEKRYRQNINDKIAALRDSVPALRAMSQGGIGSDAENDDTESQSVSHKLNKATVLSMATDYIKHLERRCGRLSEQCETQRTRLEAVAKLEAAGRLGNFSGATGNQGMFSDVDLAGDPGATHNMMRYQQPRNQATGQAIPSRRSPPRMREHGDSSRRSSGGTISKLMVGGMASLMAIEGFNEVEPSGSSPGGRGLFALPLEIVNGFHHLVTRPGGAAFASAHNLPFNPNSVLLLVRIVLIFGAILYILSPSFFDRTSPRGDEKNPTSNLSAASTAAASPNSGESLLEGRRKAWLTAMQTMDFPRKALAEDPVGVTAAFLRYCLRYLINPDVFARVVGKTRDQELARVKAWEVALDAQLAGGDTEISNARLAFTFIGSLGLLEMPRRLMLRALHVKILFMDSGYPLEGISTKLAVRYWNEARTLHKLVKGDTSIVAGSSNSSGGEEMSSKEEKEKTLDDDLPAHLSALLSMDFNDVFHPSILRRLHNLAFRLPITSSKTTTTGDEGMDAVTEDFSILTPLDALAAWVSSFRLQQGLIRYLELAPSAISTTIQAEKENAQIGRCIRDAIEVAPPNSGAQLRALVARAVLAPPDDSRKNLDIALKALPDCEIYRVQGSKLVVQSNASLATMSGIKIALSCAMALVSFHYSQSTPSNKIKGNANDDSKTGKPPTTPLLAAIKFFNELPATNPPIFGLLGFVSTYKTLNVFAADNGLIVKSKARVEGVALVLRIWVGGERGRKCGLGREGRTRIVDGCLEVVRKCLEAGTGEEQAEEEERREVGEA